MEVGVQGEKVNFSQNSNKILDFLSYLCFAYSED